MAAILNGLALYGHFRVFGATFLVFSDYMRPSMRLAALMGLPVVYILTHDSVYVGEDGPTHQPIETTESLRLIPNLAVFRPADAERLLDWVEAMKRKDGPSALILTRQNLPLLKKPQGWDFTKGGYVVRPEQEDLAIVLVAAGSESASPCRLPSRLRQLGVRCFCSKQGLFLKQDQAYRSRVIPQDVPTQPLSCVATGWYAINPGGRVEVFGLERFVPAGLDKRSWII